MVKNRAYLISRQTGETSRGVDDMLTIELAYDRLDEVKELFREYQALLELDLCFQNFEAELAELPGKYAMPGGRLYVASYDGRPAGCIALRGLDGGGCEMKRLYVRGAFRGQKVGRSLAEKIIGDAREIGYSHMLLDTYAERMKDAVALYRKFGFTETEAYYNNPHAGVLYMRLEL